MREGFYYRISDGVLRLSSDPDGKVPVSTWADDADILHWPWESNTTVTKVVIEDEIKPWTCRHMFAAPPNLTEIEGLANLDTCHVTKMHYMFADCRSITSLDLSNLDTSHVTDMSGMFAYCTSLKSLDVSTFDTSKVWNMCNMFGDCRDLTSIEGLENLDTSHVTDMYFMFAQCKSLKSLDLSSFDTSHATDMIGMFAYCDSLTSLDLSGWDTTSVTDMYDMFDGCKSLETVTTNDKRIIGKLPDGIKGVEPSARAGRDVTPSLEDTLDQFSATMEMFQAAVTALQGNIEDMRETLDSDSR